MVIVNPVSGARGRRDAGRRRVALARAVLAAEDVAGEVHVTAGAGDATARARTAVADGAALVVAWGGDGTVNEVGRALAFGATPLGIVPAGSGNGLARELALPGDPGAALRVALRGEERSIDAGELGGRLFFNTAGIGVDAEVAARFNARPRGRRGLLAYLALATREIAVYRAREYALDVDGDRLATRALLVAVGNARQYGGGALIAPAAQVDDGLLDLVVVEARSPLAVLWQARRLFTGSLARAPGVVMRRFARLAVTAAAPVRFHVDGEPVSGDTHLTGRVHPGALRVRVPARTTETIR